MPLFTLYEETPLSNGEVFWKPIIKGVSLQKAERRRHELEKQGKRCAIQQYREASIV